jgi:hypothetical protein
MRDRHEGPRESEDRFHLTALRDIEVTAYVPKVKYLSEERVPHGDGNGNGNHHKPAVMKSLQAFVLPAGKSREVIAVENVAEPGGRNRILTVPHPAHVGESANVEGLCLLERIDGREG